MTSFSVWDHHTNEWQCRCQEDLKCISSGRWKTLPGRRQITWMKTVLEDLESYKISLTEAVKMAQNFPL